MLLLSALMFFDAGISRAEAVSQPAEPVKRAPALALDGSAYRTESYKKSGAVRGEDVLVFDEGNFVSENCLKQGFVPAPYWIRREGHVTHFLAEAVSPHHGTMLWKGTIDGDKIQGSYVWTKERWYWTIRREVPFKGVRRK